MNCDFQVVFEEYYAHIQPVSDHSHIERNCNDKDVGQIRKDEQKRFVSKGDLEGSKSLKGCKYILASSKYILVRKDEDDRTVIGTGSSLFSRKPYVLKYGHLDKYEDLLSQYKFLFTLDLIDQKLSGAYKMTDEPSMANGILDIMDMCWDYKNTHLLWFRRLPGNHFEGVSVYATFAIFTAKIMESNKRNKTLRRQG